MVGDLEHPPLDFQRESRFLLRRLGREVFLISIESFFAPTPSGRADAWS